MNDLVILGIVLGGGLGATLVGLFIWQHFEHKRSALELKLFQMENTRLIQQWRDESRRSHEDSMAYLQGMTGSLARIIRKQEEGEGPK
ncbi:MAG: hypothetical protein ACOY5B_12365 [Spirochaetota bacterium]